MPTDDAYVDRSGRVRAVVRVAACACLWLLAAAAFLEGDAAAQDAAGAKKPAAAALFEERCATCHTVPDPEIRTDRAWLDQVHRTA